MREALEKLLATPDHSAGGIMTTEFVSVDPNLHRRQALKRTSPRWASQGDDVRVLRARPGEERLLGVSLPRV